MNLKNLLLKPIKFYRYFSPAFGNKCRYYPTCSEYAIWEIENDNILKAMFKIVFRILRCNQLFPGGIEYPVVTKKLIPCYKKTKIKYWYVPVKNKKNKFYVIKAL